MNAVVSTEPHLLTSVVRGVGVATFNRPERRNALSSEMVEALSAVLAEWEDDPAVGAIVINGSGTAFCAGGDVKAFAERGGEAGGTSVTPGERIARQQARQRETTGRLHLMATPTIAALNGPAAGAGLGLALACDFRVGCSRSALVTAFASVGLSGDYGVAWLLTRLAGPAAARRLMLLGERVEADEAVRLGLLTRLVDEQEVLDTSIELGARLATGPRDALRLMKANLLDAERLDLPAAMDQEVTRHQFCGSTDDHREAVQAFVHKRAPRFGRHEGRQDL